MTDNWISIEDAQPEDGQEVIACGTWDGEICGKRETDFVGMGTWHGNYVGMESDTYSTNIVDITDWMPAPSAPPKKVVKQ